MKLLTLEDYQKAVNHSGQSIGMLPKNLVRRQAEDILKVMETLGGVSTQSCLEEKLTGPSVSIRKKNQIHQKNKYSKEKNHMPRLNIFSRVHLQMYANGEEVKLDDMIWAREVIKG